MPSHIPASRLTDTFRPNSATPRPTSRHSGASTSRRSGGCSRTRSEEHTSELQSPCNLVCRLLLEKKKSEHKWSDRRCSSVAFSEGGAVCTVTLPVGRSWFFFFNETATTEIYTLSLHDALPI